MKLINLEQRSPQWLQWRRNKITASEAPIIMGSSPYKCINKLLVQKVKGDESPTMPWMQRGIDLEPIALKEFEKETGLIMFPAVAEHENGWMGASFDGLTLDEDAICEIKVPGKKDHQIALDGMVPSKYFAQLQHQIYVSGLDFAYYYSFDGNKGIILEVKRDQGFIEEMIAKEFEFWQCLRTFNNFKTFEGINDYATSTIP